MTETLFSALELPEKLQMGITEMGFDTATPIQAQTIPLIRTGADVIAKSQTGTGKTVAFAIPVLERIDTQEEKSTVQVLILCPTRELAQQAGEEIRKLSKFMTGIRPVEVFGGASMERQLIQLRRANIVIGTPGRVMDHMRRKSLKLGNLKIVVLDEADEMLSMGFKEDIETILQDAPEGHQTILFSATMPPAIRALAKQFQTDPQSVEIDRGQVTIQNIDQSCVDVPHERKADALALLMEFHRPNRALVFCNTKRMVDELTQLLTQRGFAAESIHGDHNQAQRTSVMNAFKGGRISILVATDVAARGIDVNDLDYVFNFDIPLTTEYYVHRIGRTGRAGKSGNAITLCSGRRQMQIMRSLAREVKAEIRQDNLPTADRLKTQEQERNLALAEAALELEPTEAHAAMLQALLARGHSLEQIATAALGLSFPEKKHMDLPASVPSMRYESSAPSRRPSPRSDFSASYVNLVFDIGASNRVVANHLVGAITERAGIAGKEIGKIQILAEQSIVGIPVAIADDVLAAMRGCKVCGKPVHVTKTEPEPRDFRARKSGRPMGGRPGPKGGKPFAPRSRTFGKH